MSFMDEFNSGSAPGLSSDRLNEPFHLKSMVYDSVNDKIDLTFGRGRVVFLDTIVEKVLESTYSILTPTINTTYYIYLKNDGTYTHNTTGTTPAGALKLWAVSTGSTVDVLSKSDMRALIDASGRSVQDNLDAHQDAADPHPQYKLDTDAPNAHASSHASGGSDPITPADIGAEPSFTKNTAFNKNFGTASGTVAEGNRVIPIQSDGGAVSLANGTDLNTITTTGIYNGDDLTNNPESDLNWWYIEVIRHTNNNGYCLQRATSLNGSGKTYYRRQSGGTWGEWKEYWHAGNAAKKYRTESLTTISTSSTTYADVLTLTFSTSSSGRGIVQFYSRAGTPSSGVTGYVRLLINGTQVGGEMRFTNGYAENFPNIHEVADLVNGSNTIKIQMKTSDGTSSASLHVSGINAMVWEG
jgi:hypothetical protein